VEVLAVHDRKAGSAAIGITAVAKRFDGVAAVSDVSLEVAPGTVAALLGPSGSGKTTLLRLLAGFEVPDAGSVRIGERVVAGDGAWVEPEERRVGMLFQHGALFPHLDVEGNVRFGATSRAHAADCLRLVGLASRGGAFPHELSGGERQRVALARALAAEPQVVLLDEPFAALDPALRERLRDEVVAILREAGTTTLLVTHDQDEALSVADAIALLRAGRVEQVGAPEEVYDRPRTRWVAEFLGDANLLPGRAVDGTVECALGSLPVASGPEGDVLVVVRPEALVRDATGAAGVVTSRSFLGDHQVLRVALDGSELRWTVAGRGAPRTGEQVGLRVEGDVSVLPADHARGATAR
jgi:iron(III) transport system ATP-binding protein